MIEAAVERRHGNAVAAGRAYSIASGERIYAIGDVHGRADLFAELLDLISQDSAGRAPALTRIIVLGDVVDRGPDSATLVTRLMRYTKASDSFIVLKGNHEQFMAAALEGDYQALAAWLNVGGGETLLSWGVPQSLIDEGSCAKLLTTVRRQVGAEVMLWLERLPLYHHSGDVLFVHAGIRPGRPLEEQTPDDLLWIRDEFLESDVEHPYRVIHGHSVREGGPDVRPNRIGVDTGAYRTGRLAALAYEGSEHWVLST